jgi:hypothetical protein
MELLMISFVLKINLLLSSLLFVGCLGSADAIKFESAESKTSTNQPVYNSIKLISARQKDIWIMNQSHYGLNPSKEKIDRIAIIVDKSKKPKTAEFYQLPPGDLIWSENLKLQKIEYKMSCFSCHSNGPRAIRPNFKTVKMSYLNQLKIKYWNYKIASYGRIIESPDQIADHHKKIVPFRYPSILDNQKLKLVTCLKCHNNSTDSGRGFLTRQNLGTINYLISENIMPPAGYELSNSESIKLKRFIKGFE